MGAAHPNAGQFFNITPKEHLLIPTEISLPQPKLIAPISSRYVWIRPMQLTSPQFFRPGRTEVLFRYLGLHLSLKQSTAPWQRAEQTTGGQGNCVTLIEVLFSLSRHLFFPLKLILNLFSSTLLWCGMEFESLFATRTSCQSTIQLSEDRVKLSNSFYFKASTNQNWQPNYLEPATTSHYDSLHQSFGYGI